MHFLFIDPDVDIGPAIRHLDQVREVSPAFFEILTFVIGCAELFRSLKGWKSPLDAAGGIKGAIANEADVKYTPGRLQEDYYPGTSASIRSGSRRPPRPRSPRCRRRSCRTAAWP